jgi:DNA-binding CsgD family transcriptional regulator
MRISCTFRAHSRRARWGDLMQEQAAVLAPIIGAIGENNFAAVAARAVLEWVRFDLTAVVFHRRGAKPGLLFDNFDVAGGTQGIMNYVSVTHCLNPVLQSLTVASGGTGGGAGGGAGAGTGGGADSGPGTGAGAGPGMGLGVFRARDFVIRAQGIGRRLRPYMIESRDEELGYRTIGWPENLEEIGLYFGADGGVIELGFYRERGTHGMSAEHLGALAVLGTPIAAAFDRHAMFTQRMRATATSASFVSASSDTSTNLTTALAESAAMPLSRRETEVAEMLLLGCGSEAIALRLGISRYTVKDHRKQIFRKLGIGSLAELFALHRSLPIPLHGGMATRFSRRYDR